MTDKDFETMCNPSNFRLCNGTFSANRERKLTYRKYFNQRLLDVDVDLIEILIICLLLNIL